MDELKSDLDRKEDLNQEQWKEISGLRNELDHARTDKAVAELALREDIVPGQDASFRTGRGCQV